jgi:hypothetical protein
MGKNRNKQRRRLISPADCGKQARIYALSSERLEKLLRSVDPLQVKPLKATGAGGKVSNSQMNAGSHIIPVALEGTGMQPPPEVALRPVAKGTKPPSPQCPLCAERFAFQVDLQDHLANASLHQASSVSTRWAAGHPIAKVSDARSETSQRRQRPEFEHTKI